FGVDDGHVGDDAVDRMLHAHAYRQRLADGLCDVAFELALATAQVADVVPGLRAVDVQLRHAARARAALGCRDIGDAAAVCAQRRFAEHHDVGAGTVRRRGRRRSEAV